MNAQATIRKSGFGHTLLRAVKNVPPVVYMIVILAGIFSFTSKNFLSWNNIQNILVQSVPLLILAMGQTLIVLTQGTDLSLGAQVSFATVMWIWMAQKGIPFAIGAVLTLVFTVIFGSLNGLLVGKGKIMPFIATLGMQNIINSISLTITSGSSIYINSTLFMNISETKILFLPLPVWIAVAVFALTWILLRNTRFGANIVGLGGNPEALSLAGINTTLCLVKTYAYAGLVAGIAGLVTACRVESGQPTVGTGWEFDAVAATLLGGTSMREGRGGVVGTVFGVLLIKMLANGLNISGVSALYQNATIGSIVLAAIVIDALIRRNKKE